MLDNTPNKIINIQALNTKISSCAWHDWPRNYIWWATGGVDIDNPTIEDDSTEINKHGEWKTLQIGPNGTKISLALNLFSHCTVQINNFETAIIGGIDQSYIRDQIVVNNNVSRFIHSKKISRHQDTKLQQEFHYTQIDSKELKKLVQFNF